MQKLFFLNYQNIFFTFGFEILIKTKLQTKCHILHKPDLSLKYSKKLHNITATYIEEKIFCLKLTSPAKCLRRKHSKPIFVSERLLVRLS